MTNWFKESSYNYIEDLLDQINQVSTRLTSPGGSQCVECIKYLPDLQKVQGRLQKSWGQPLTQDISGHIYNARRLLSIIQKNLSAIGQTPQQANTADPLSETLSPDKSSWHNWENKGSIVDRISFVPSAVSGMPGEIKLHGFMSDWNKSNTAKEIVGAMRSWIKIIPKPSSDPKSILKEYDVYIRGTKEAWSKFQSLSHLWLENHDSLSEKKFRLPSEKEFDPNYAGEEEKPKDKNKKPMNASAIMDTDPKDPSKTKMKGIRILLDPKDENFWQVRDLIVKDAGMAKMSISYQNRSFEIYETDRNKWTVVWKKLQFWDYDNVPQLNALIEQITGKSVGKVQQEQAKTIKARDLSEVEVKNALNSNLVKDENGNVAPGIAKRFGVNAPLSEEQFNLFAEQNYPGAFGPTIPDSQRKAQKHGMYFLASRRSAILADQPGSGKTAQATVAADMVREDGQKVLVISPNMLVGENWVGPKAKGPMMFCGHQREQIAECKDPGSIQAAISNPNIIWVVVPFSTFARKDWQEVSTIISNASKSGVFSSMIFDEIQTIKNSDGRSFKAIQKAISAAGIKHRFGLTGTPSDNNPSDIYNQLQLVRHPLLYSSSGKDEWIIRQNQKGFTKQFIGGPGFADPITLTTSERKLSSPDEQAELLDRKGKVKGIVMDSWAKSLNNAKKLQILDLFAQTFLRRNKEDLRPDMPPKDRNANAIPMPKDAMPAGQYSKNWHVQHLKEMAHKKVPYTVAKANGYLQDPTQQLFIATKHPEIAAEIVEGINRVHGDGAAAYVAGNTKDNARQLIPNTFREGNSALPGKQVALRAVVYTMELGAVGLNFSNATKAIFNDFEWNPSVNLQAEDRIHRIDSQRPVNVDYMFFAGSYDEEVFQRIQIKQNANNAVANIIQKASTTKDINARLALADQFIGLLKNSLMMDIDIEKDTALASALDSVQTTEEPAAQPEMAQRAASSSNVRKLGRSWFSRNLS